MHMQRFNAYLFDLDGTLVDTAPDLHIALNHVLEKNGLQNVDLSLTRHWVGHGAKAMLTSALTDLSVSGFSDAKIDEMHLEFVDHYASHIADRSKPYEGVVEALKKLHGEAKPLGVVTNKRYDLSFQLLNEIDLYQYMDVLVGGDTLQVQKPMAEPLLYACNELDVEPAQTLYVGDSSTDVECARAAGCDVVVVRDGYNHGQPAQTLGADQVVDSFLDLL